MGVWRGRWYLLTSFALCACAVILGTLLYPLVLLFFSLIALMHALFWRGGTDKRSSSPGSPVEGNGA